MHSREFLLSNGQLLSTNPMEIAKVAVASTDMKEIAKVGVVKQRLEGASLQAHLHLE